MNRGIPTLVATVLTLFTLLVGCSDAGPEGQESTASSAEAQANHPASVEPSAGPAAGDLPYDDDLAMHLMREIVGIEGADLEGSKGLAQVYCDHFEEMMGSGSTWDEALGVLAGAHGLDDYTEDELETFAQILIISVNWQCPQYSDHLSTN